MEKRAPADHLALGLAGEREAAAYLRALGWKILSRNWRPVQGANGGGARNSLLELDIIARDKDSLVFVEVKTRKRTGAPESTGAEHMEDAEGIPAYAAFTAKKRGLLVRAASLYCTAHMAWDRPCRFDLICAYGRVEGPFSLEHYRDVIDFGHIVGGGDAAWQPW